MADHSFRQTLDELTLARAKRRDPVAFARIYERYARACFNLGLRMLGDAGRAEDLTQDVFIKVLERIGGFRGDAPFGAWLKRIVVHAAIDQIRGPHPMQNFSDFGDGDFPEPEWPGRNPQPDVGPDLERLLMSLPTNARAVVVLHEIEGYSHEEIAQMFGMSPSFSKSLLSRSLKRLRQQWSLVPAAQVGQP